MAANDADKSKALAADEIFTGFQQLRSEQRQIASKISELEMDLNEHNIVLETLQSIDKMRKCFRMVGGILVEKVVGEVVTDLESNRDRLPKTIENLKGQLTRKGEEINKYIETHDIRVHRSERPPEVVPEQPSKPNVLVAKE